MNNEARLYGKVCEEMVKFWPRVGSIYWDFPCFFQPFLKKKKFLRREHEHLFQCINESHMGLLYTSLCDQRSTLNWPYLLLGTCHAPGAHATSPWHPDASFRQVRLILRLDLDWILFITLDQKFWLPNPNSIYTTQATHSIQI